MCSNYVPVTDLDRMLAYFGVRWDKQHGVDAEVWPLGLAPFIRLAEDGSGNRVIEDGLFGLLPHFAAELAFGRKTYNARSETVHAKPSFRDAWRRGQRCIIPAELVYEQCYESGRAVRWAVQREDRHPMGIAGIYEKWRDPDGRVRGTFSMLTVNAGGHPVYCRFSAPGDAKRMLVILDEADYGRWLSCAREEASQFFRQWPGTLKAWEAPRPGAGARLPPRR